MNGQVNLPVLHCPLAMYKQWGECHEAQISYGDSGP